MYLKQINGNIIDLSTIESFRKHYSDPTSYAVTIINQINGGHFPGIAPGNVALDIGANIGLFSVYLAPYFKRIYALEPSNGHYNLLQEIVQQKDLNNIIPIHAALFDRNMRMPFYTNSNNSTMNNLVCSFGEDLGSVAAMDLDCLLYTYGIETVDLMKMDVEGSEMKIIPDNCFFKCSPKIKRLMIEVHDFIMGGQLLGSNTDFIQTLLDSYGFHTTRQSTDSILATR